MPALPVDLKTLYYIVEWAIRIGSVAVIPFRRAPAASRSWLLLIFFLPIPGLLLFLAIGRPDFPKWRRERFRKLEPYLRHVADEQRRQTIDLGHAAPIADLAQALGRMPPVGGNSVALIDDYDQVFERLIADIDAARLSVLLLVYIFADDAVGHRVAEALGRAVQRGLECRVMFDPVGSHKWRRGTIKMLTDQRVEVREALPFRLLRGRTRRDMRNHRKLFVIDGAIGYAGSQNIVARDFKPGIVNRELVARISGPVVASMEALVRCDWAIEDRQPPAPIASLPPSSGDALVQLLPSGANYRLEGFATLLVWQIHQARERVIMVTPYFIPDEDVLGAMTTAVARGVKVDLILSAAVDQRLVNLSQSSYYDELLAAGIGIKLFRDELLHAKNVSIDRRVGIVGSSNVDLRSFQLNEEASVILYDPASIAALESIQQGYLDHSDALDLAQWRRRPRLRRLAENIAGLMGSLL